MRKLYVTTVRTLHKQAAATTTAILAELGSGWEVTAGWINAAWIDSASWEKTCATVGLEEIAAADAVVVLETSSYRGTLWADLGYALALDIPVFILEDWMPPYTSRPYHARLDKVAAHTTVATLAAAIRRAFP